jgi:hypothetical protein
MRKINQCLNPVLMSVCQQAIELESLTAIVQDYIKPFTAAPCSVISLNKGCLVLLVETALSATELRYQLPALRDYLRSHMGLHQLVTIKIQVRPSHLNRD